MTDWALKHFDESCSKIINIVGMLLQQKVLSLNKTEHVKNV